MRTRAHIRLPIPGPISDCERNRRVAGVNASARDDSTASSSVISPGDTRAKRDCFTPSARLKNEDARCAAEPVVKIANESDIAAQGDENKKTPRRKKSRI